MILCDGNAYRCPAPASHEEIVFDGMPQDCPLGLALQQLDAANEELLDVRAELVEARKES